MIYPKPPLQNLLNQKPELLTEIWAVLDAIPLNDLLKESRIHGGGLYKIEPKELRRVTSKQLTEIILKNEKEP